MSCLFCSIINKEKPAYIFYEDDAVVAFLDVFPHALGHTLVVPKRHMETMLELRDDELASFWKGVRRALEVLNRSLEPDGFTIGINHGKVGGQAVEHLHIHLMPRFLGDGGGSLHSVIKNPGTQSVEEVYKQITEKN